VSRFFPLAALALAALSACATPKSLPSTSAAEAGMPAASVAPMDLAGQKVLLLPVQAAAGIAAGRDAVTAELVYAIGERDTRTRWVTPDALRRALARTPDFAPDPSALPPDAYLHHAERRIVEPLAGAVRRYSALMDARLVLIPREARFVPSPAGQGGTVRIGAVMVDARTGGMVWFGEADGELRPAADEAAVASAAAALAARMLVGDSR
jgi:hypothetical protein